MFKPNVVCEETFYVAVVLETADFLNKILHRVTVMAFSVSVLFLLPLGSVHTHLR